MADSRIVGSPSGIRRRSFDPREVSPLSAPGAILPFQNPMSGIGSAISTLRRGVNAFGSLKGPLSRGNLPAPEDVMFSQFFGEASPLMPDTAELRGGRLPMQRQGGLSVSRLPIGNSPSFDNEYSPPMQGGNPSQMGPPTSYGGGRLLPEQQASMSSPPVQMPTFGAPSAMRGSGGLSPLSDLANEANQLGSLTERIRAAGGGVGPNAQAGLAQDLQNYNDAYQGQMQSMQRGNGITPQERTAWNEQQGYGFHEANGANFDHGQGGAIGAGMANRFLGPNAVSPLSPRTIPGQEDMGLGYSEYAGGYGDAPNRYYRQMSNDDSISSIAMGRAAATGRDASEYTSMDDQGRLALTAPANTPEQVAANKAKDAARSAQYRAANGGMSRREVERQKRRNASDISRLRAAGVDPLTMLKITNPEMAARLRNRRGAGDSPLASGARTPAPPALGQVSPEGVQQSQAYVATQEPTTNLATMHGWDPDTPVYSIRQNFDEMRDNGVELSDGDLVDLQRSVKARNSLAKSKGEDPYNGFHGMLSSPRDKAWSAIDQGFWGELAGLGEDPRKLRDWETRRNKAYDEHIATYVDPNNYPPGDTSSMYQPNFSESPIGKAVNGAGTGFF